MTHLLLIGKAEMAGRKAFKDGRSSAPAQDPAFGKILNSRPRGSSSIPYLDAWTRGWHDENIKAPVPGWTHAENEALRKVRGSNMAKGDTVVKSRAFDVYLNSKKIDTVFQTSRGTLAEVAEEVRRSLINHDGYDSGIRVVAARRRVHANRALGSIVRGRKLAKKLRRRTDGTFKPEGTRAKPKPRTCRCDAYPFPHARGGGSCPR